ncbi:Ig-like domain-containing protein, partial [Polluticoccus soli]|uniref:Ig-like domain-containing protein n=1 Tax=Polluticoccus soli TaxID=3034150 RepID=UPI0023E28114
TIDPVNDPPVAVNDTTTTNEDTPVNIPVVKNDSDPDNPLGIPIVGIPPSNGTVVVNADSTITYTPDLNFNGTDSFTYAICDGGTPNLCDTATVFITIDPVNDPPVAVNDTTTTNEDTPVTIPVLANDSDPDDPLGVPIVGTPPANGSVVVNADSTITYTPDLNFNGTDSFTYAICDGGTPNLCDTATVYITIDPVNDPPVAVNDTTTTSEDTPVTIPVLANDSDSDSPLGVPIVGTPPSNGSVVVNADSTITYIPDPNFNGTDSFTYAICDGGTPNLCDTATVFITIDPVNDPPVAVNDTALCNSISGTAIAVLSNDLDVDGDILQGDSISLVVPIGATNIITNANGNIIGATMPGEGAWSVASNGIITFMPITGFTNAPTPMGYTVKDSMGAVSNTAIIVLPSAIVTSVSITPIACNGGLGAIDLAVTGGSSGNYTYSWSNSAVTEDLSNIPAGVYVVTITDGNGCTHIDTVILQEPALLSATTTSIQPTCNGGTGSIDLTVNGGIAPYSYNWSNGATTEDLTNLTQGVYTVTITDANGCTTIVSDTIDSGPTVITATTLATNVTCDGKLGAIDLTVAGGTPPYSYSWSNGAVTEDLDSLTTGIYTVIITDFNGCITTHTDTIRAPQLPVVDAVANQVVCNQDTIIQITFSGTPSFATYVWQNSDTTIGLGKSGTGSIPSFVAVNTTNQPITATITVVPYSDSCIGTQMSFTITVNPSPDVMILDVRQPTEINPFGSIEVLSPRGANFSYALDGGAYQTSPLFMNLAGDRSYIISVMNEHNCNRDTIITVNGLEITVNPVDTCHIPNVITPNYDNANDYFVIDCIQDNVEISIYNRWGNQVYHSSSYKNDWSAEGLNGGTYYYVIRMPATLKNRAYHGYVEVIK